MTESRFTITRPIIIEEADPAWPRRFAEDRARIAAALAPLAPQIEHIGSTAVAGLAAKPVIDIMIGLDALDQAAPCIPALAALGYCYVPEYEAVMPYRRFFYLDTAGVRTHHIHMVAVTHEFWERHLLFRDYLRAHPDAASEYAALKQQLARRFVDDMAGYTDGKTEFIRRIEALALQRD